MSYIKFLRLPVIIYEIKNEEISKSNSEARSQGIVYFIGCVKSQKKMIATNTPCMIISICGTYDSVRSVVLFDSLNPNHRVVETMHDSVDLCDSEAVHTLARLFQAVSRCVGSIVESTLKSLQEVVPEVLLDQIKFPCDCTLKRAGGIPLPARAPGCPAGGLHLQTSQQAPNCQVYSGQLQRLCTPAARLPWPSACAVRHPRPVIPLVENGSDGRLRRRRPHHRG